MSTASERSAYHQEPATRVTYRSTQEFPSRFQRYTPASASTLNLAGFECRDDREVRSYIASHRHLFRILRELRKHIDVHFGEDARAILEVVSEPENSGQPCLFAYVQCSESRQECRAKLQAFDREWWIDAVPRARGRCNVTLEYR